MARYSGSARFTSLLTVYGKRSIFAANRLCWPHGGINIVEANRRWHWPFRCRGSRQETAVAQLSTLACMNWLKTIGIVVGISSLYYGLVIIAGAFTGAGHGSYFFLEAVVAPFLGSGLFATVGTIMFWPLVSILLALRRFSACRIAAAVGLVAHYLGIAIICSKAGWDDGVGRVWEYWPGTVAAFVALYFGSQIFMWVLIARKQNSG